MNMPVVFASSYILMVNEAEPLSVHLDFLVEDSI